MQLRVQRFLTRKRIWLFNESFRRWKAAIVNYSEANMINSHFNDTAVDMDSNLTAYYANSGFETSQFLRHFTEESEADFLKKTSRYLIPKGQQANDGEDNDLLSLPLKLPEIPPIMRSYTSLNSTQLLSTREEIELDELNLNSKPTPSSRPVSPNVTATFLPQNQLTLPLISSPSSRPNTSSQPPLPSYFPSEGITNLPNLPEMYQPSTAEGRLTIQRSRRVGYCGFNLAMRGPTDNSFWIIPNRVACGSIPLGNGCTTEGRVPVSSISALMLAGIDFFVSLMEEAEEIQCEEEHFQQVLKEER